MTSAFRPVTLGVKFQSVVVLVLCRPALPSASLPCWEVRKQQRVFVLEAIKLLQDGRAVVVKAVVAPPLQKPDLDGHLRQLESVGLNLNGFELVNADLWLEAEAELRQQRRDFFFEVQEQSKGYIKKIAAAASGVQHGHVRNLFQECGQPFALGGSAVAVLERGGKFAFDLRPFAAERCHEDWLNQRQDVGLAGVVRAKLRALVRVQSAFKEMCP